MQTQDAPAELLVKFWPWFEANRKRLILVGVAALVIFFIWFFISSQRQQKELAAGQAYTKLQLSLPPNPTVQQVADAYLKIANDYAGTVAAQRAQLQAAALYFSAGRYADAQALFQKSLASAGGSPLAAGARMGVAACLEAQGKLDAAAAEYHAVATSNPEAVEAIASKFAQGRVLELQGKLNEASAYYQEVTRAPLAGSMAQEAAQRLALIQTKIAATKPAAKS
jgi:predicted negative regulator of RcsB-dependent stress response